MAVGRRGRHEVAHAFTGNPHATEMLGQDAGQCNLDRNVRRYHCVLETSVREGKERAIQTAPSLVVGVVVRPCHGGLRLHIGRFPLQSNPQHVNEKRRLPRRIGCIEVDDCGAMRQGQQKLDAAKEVDPEGEKEARVIAARRVLREGTSDE